MPRDMLYAILKSCESNVMKCMWILLVATTMGLPSAAQAQDMVVMRRPISVPNRTPATPPQNPAPASPVTPPASDPAVPTSLHRWSPGDWTWAEGVGTCTAKGSQTRQVTCVDDKDVPVSDALCTAARPSTTQTIDRAEGCGYAWTEGSWSDEGACAAGSKGTRTVTCRRSDGVDAPGRCVGEAPVSSRTGDRLEGCLSTGWSTTDWAAWTPGCSVSATRTRTVQCQARPRSGSAFDIDERNCTNTRPDAGEGPVEYYGACTGHWEMDAWTATAQCNMGDRPERRVASCRTADGSTAGSEGLCDPNGRPRAETRTGSCLKADETRIPSLSAGEHVDSANGRYRLEMRLDGVLAIKDMTTGSTVWRITDQTMQKLGPDSPGSAMNVQGDGNLVIYSSNADGGSPRWNSFTWNAAGAYFALSDDGHLRIVTTAGQVIYQSSGETGADYHWNPFESRYVP